MEYTPLITNNEVSYMSAMSDHKCTLDVAGLYAVSRYTGQRYIGSLQQLHSPTGIRMSCMNLFNVRPIMYTWPIRISYPTVPAESLQIIFISSLWVITLYLKTVLEVVVWSPVYCVFHPASQQLWRSIWFLLWPLNTPIIYCAGMLQATIGLTGSL